MAKIPSIVPITDLRQAATALVKRVSTSREPLFITQRGRASAVMVSIEEYERTQHELEILRLIAAGEKEIAAGIGHRLDDILAEADSLQKEPQR